MFPFAVFAILRPSALSIGAPRIVVSTVMGLLCCALRLPAASSCSTFRVWAPALKAGVVKVQPPM